MKSSLEKNIDSDSNPSEKISSCNYKDNETVGSVSTEAEPSISSSKPQKVTTLFSGVWPIFASSDSNCKDIDSKNCGIDSNNRRKTVGKNYYDSWRAAVRRVMLNGVSMRRILGFSRAANVSASRNNIWILGVCYKVVTDGDDASTSDPSQSEGYTAFVEDFSSRVLITYRKGFGPIGDTKYCSDVSWGCMLRSSQMLVAQAFVVHKLGRSWRKSLVKQPLDQTYLEILHLFGDSDDSPCSIHNLLEAGKAYGLAAGSWIGPYATSRAWESLVRHKREESPNGILSTMMAMYVVSGDGDGERGGAPVLCIEDLCKHCSEFSEGQSQWSPVLLMVPLVLGLEKVNPRYLPLLGATFTFPQSLGIMGGRPGASTYIVGVQDEKAFYLDPHEVQQAVDIKSSDLEVDTSSYHCNVVRHMPLDSIDSSLAIGFYCRDKADFEDFCVRASDLISQSNGAPLFTIAETKTASQHTTFKDNTTECCDYDPSDGLATGQSENNAQEDDWQLL